MDINSAHLPGVLRMISYASCNTALAHFWTVAAKSISGFNGRGGYGLKMIMWHGHVTKGCGHLTVISASIAGTPWMNVSIAVAILSWVGSAPSSSLVLMKSLRVWWRLFRGSGSPPNTVTTWRGRGKRGGRGGGRKTKLIQQLENYPNRQYGGIFRKTKQVMTLNLLCNLRDI